MKKLIIGMGLFTLIIIFLLLIASCSTNNRIYTYNEVEDLLVRKVINKYKNSDYLPKENSRLEVSINTLIENGEMKNINEYTGTDDSCSAKVTIFNNNGYYLYIPSINCGEKYKTNNLYNTLINDSLTNEGNGLYKVNDEYIFKGDKVNNYVNIEGIIYRVININSDGTIKLLEANNKKSRILTVWDDRFNIDKNMNSGINNYYSNKLNSRIKDIIEDIYESDEYYTDIQKSYFIPYEYCIGKRSITENDNSGIIECSEKTEKYPMGLISLYEFYRATLDSNCTSIESDSCTNYNYLSDYDLGSFWTMTADKNSSYKVFKIVGGKPALSNASSSSNTKIVVNVNGAIVVDSGNGSFDNPYIIKSIDN